MRTAVWLLAAVLAFYALLCGALFVLQRSLIYFPVPARGGDASTRFELQVAGARLTVSHRPHAGPRALIYFGGNAEDVSLTLPLLAGAFESHAIYLPHYRGYGDSTGQPTEDALHADAQALFDHVRRTHTDIVLIGQSLGSGVALRLASQRPASRLVLVTPYDSLANIAARQFPYVPVRWLLQDTFESWRYAPAIDIPALLIEAELDEVIPAESTRQLLASFRPGVASHVVVPRAGHNTISGSPAYLEALRRGVDG